MTTYLSARQAADRLGVSLPTLYAYVSRGLLRAFPASDPRVRRYNGEAVERLAAARRRGRKPKEAAKTALDFGLLALESGLTLIRDGRLFHRGLDALALAESAAISACPAARLSRCLRSAGRRAGSRMRWSSARRAS